MGGEEKPGWRMDERGKGVRGGVPRVLGRGTFAAVGGLMVEGGWNVWGQGERQKKEKRGTER